MTPAGPTDGEEKRRADDCDCGTSDGSADGMSDELLHDVVKRASVFDALSDGPLSAADLADRVDMSRSTVHRTTQSFVDAGLLEKRDSEFTLSGLGHALASELDTFRMRVDADARLEPFFNTVGPTDVDLPVECFADARVTVPKARRPHFAVERIIDLIEESDSMRMFSSVISPVYVDAALRAMASGTDIEVVFDGEVLDIIVAEFQDQAMEGFETGRFTVHVHDDVPFELFLFDDAIGMAAHDDHGIARVFVETDCDEAYDWANDLFERYRVEADSVEMDG